MICFEKNFIKTCQILEVFGAKKLRQIVGHIKLADTYLFKMSKYEINSSKFAQISFEIPIYRVQKQEFAPFP